ncbi:MAG: hypothetical protein VYA67_23990 [Actinomycetota bacterium]|uniref:Proline rich protein n=1 Tax=Mycobacterium lentiflavum TaxID=141349 RepID=A0ABY3UYH6_MYCLN|nr:hypothetical protein [Mycobacterium lentiflavum]MEE3066956.1 hypothetical protein [Actinomycetota bacterium]ULP43749.1 hypothetical protein MJO58_07250 [Mycobacterium lentiflavum]
MKLTLNVLEKHRDEEHRWPRYMFGGRMRTSTVALVIAFLAIWWVYDINHAEPAPKAPAPQVVPPGFVPDPNYTWVPRTRVQPPATTYVPTPTSTVPPSSTTTPPPPPTTTTSPPPFQLPCLLPPPFCPPSPSPSSPPPQQPPPGPGPSPTSAPPAR